MPDITINTDDPQYQQLLTGLDTLRTTLAPRIKLLLQLPANKQKAWLQRDPLLRRTLKLAQAVSDLRDLEVQE